MAMDKESLVHLIWEHCDFYKGSEKDLECGAFKILKSNQANFSRWLGRFFLELMISKAVQ